MFYVDEAFPLQVVSLWSDPRQGVLKQAVASPNPLLRHCALVGDDDDVRRLSVDRVAEAVEQSRERRRFGLCRMPKSAMSAIPSRTWQTLLPACLLIAILPVTHTVALRLLLLALTLGIALRAWLREPHPPIPARAMLAVWSAIAVASLAWSVDREYSSGEVINEIGYAMAAYFSFFALGRTEHDFRRLMIGLFVGVGLASAYALV